MGKFHRGSHARRVVGAKHRPPHDWLALFSLLHEIIVNNRRPIKSRIDRARARVLLVVLVGQRAAHGPGPLFDYRQPKIR